MTAEQSRKGALGGAWARLRLVPFLLSAFLAAPAAAQDKVLHWERYDVDLTVEPDGGLLVVEDQLLAFDRGSFRFGVRNISHLRLDSIDVLSVGDGEREYARGSGERPGSYRVEQGRGTTDVRYFFPPGGVGEQRRVLIRYRVRGALRSFPDSGVDQLDWKAIPGGNPFPTRASTLTVRAPEGAGLVRLGVQGWSGRTELVEGESLGRVVLEAPIPAGREVEVVAEWPQGVVSFARPAWQDDVDRRAVAGASLDRQRSLAAILFLSLGALLAIGGPVTSYLLWHERGRDPEVGLIAEELREPPSTLRPGLVGCLVDERAELRDVLATMMDLARRGHLQIKETSKEAVFGLIQSKDYELRATGAPPPTAESERLLLTGLLGTSPRRSLSELRNRFHVVLPKVTAALMKEATEAGLFVENPAKVRLRWGCGAGVALVLGTGLSVAVAIGFASVTRAAWVLPAGWAVAALALTVVSFLMPRKTRAGAEELGRWLAFRRHLTRARAWRDAELDPTRIDRWLPYAIAFGLERDLLEAFEQSTAPAPAWWVGERDGSRGPSFHRGTGRVGAGGTYGESSGGGGLAQASSNLGASLGQLSTGLGAMLASASSALSSAPSSSGGGGGGFSGGGGSFGGGSGGGGSSFG